MDKQTEKSLKYLRNGSKTTIKRSDILTSVMDENLISVKVVEPSIVLFNGARQSAQPGKVYDLNRFGRQQVQDWIDIYGLSVVANETKGELKPAEDVPVVETLKPQPTVEPVAKKVEDIPAKPGFNMTFGTTNTAKKGGQHKKG